MDIFGTTVRGVQYWYYTNQASWEGLKESLHNALKEGDAGAISTLHQALQKRVQEANLFIYELVDLLAAKDIDRQPGLYWALAQGHAEAISAYKELLVPFAEKIQPDQLVGLLMAKGYRGIPGLYVALKNGHAEVIHAYKELFHTVWKALSAEKQPSCVSGFFDALEAFNKAYLRLVLKNLETDVKTLTAYFHYQVHIANWRQDFQLEETGQRNEENALLTITTRIGYGQTPTVQLLLDKAKERREQGNGQEAHYIYEKLITIPEVDKEGKAEAAYQLGMMYWEGKNGIDQNEEQAIAWFKQAYQSTQQAPTQARAAFALGASYSALSLWSSLSLDESKEELALEWYQTALSHQHPDAQQKIEELTSSTSTFSLGVFFGEGKKDHGEDFHNQL